MTKIDSKVHIVAVISSSLGVGVTVSCGYRVVKRLSDVKAAPSGVMVTHFTVK
jgi:hypothetical protein